MKTLLAAMAVKKAADRVNGAQIHASGIKVGDGACADVPEQISCSTKLQQIAGGSLVSGDQGCACS